MDWGLTSPQTFLILWDNGRPVCSIRLCDRKGGRGDMGREFDCHFQTHFAVYGCGRSALYDVDVGCRCSVRPVAKRSAMNTEASGLADCTVLYVVDRYSPAHIDSCTISTSRCSIPPRPASPLIVAAKQRTRQQRNRPRRSLYVDHPPIDL